MGITQQSAAARLIQPGVCTSSTRPASPFEGQAIFETDTDRMLIWNGTAWVVPNAPAQNPTGLELVTTATCSSGGTASNGVITVGSAVSSVVVGTAFSSTYDNYRITYTGGTGSTSPIALSVQLGSTTTGYYSITLYYAYTSADGGTPSVVADNNDVQWTYVGAAATTGAKLSMDLFCPNLATRTTFAAGYNEFGSANAGHTSGYLNDSTQYTSFTIKTTSGTLTGGTIRVYGYRN